MPSLLDGGSREYVENSQNIAILFLFALFAAFSTDFWSSESPSNSLPAAMAGNDCGASAKVGECGDISRNFSNAVSGADIMARSASRLPPSGSGRIAETRARARINVHRDHDLNSTFPRGRPASDYAFSTTCNDPLTQDERCSNFGR